MSRLLSQVPWTTPPSQPVPISPYWLERGLVAISLGDGRFWTRTGGWTYAPSVTGNPKKRPFSKGLGFGFGTNANNGGTGTTDRLTGPTIQYSTAFRSMVTFSFANTTGGGALGRILNANGASGAGTTGGEGMWPSGTREMTYTRGHATTAHSSGPLGTAVTGREVCWGITHDQRTNPISGVPVFYRDGVPTAVAATESSSASGARQDGFYTLDIGNRSTDSTRNFDGIVGMALIFDHPSLGLTAAEHRLLFINPYVVFDPFDAAIPVQEPQNIGLTEALNLADTAVSVASLTVANTEALTLVDTADGALSGSLPVSQTDAAPLAETATASIGYAVIASDAMVLADAPGLSMTFMPLYERSSVDLSGSTITGTGNSTVVSIKPKVQESEFSGDRRWREPSVAVTGVNGFRPTFRFLSYFNADNGFRGYPWASTRRPMFSYDDGLTWTYFDTAVTIDTGNQWIEFRHSTAFTGNTVRIGRSRQVSVHQVGDWVAAMDAAHAAFNPSATAITYTPSGSVSDFAAQSYIAEEFAAQTDSLGATIPITPFYAGEINDTGLMPLNGSPKRLALIISGVHAAEDHGFWIFTALFDYLMGGSAQAQALRRRYRILVYPLMNAPGRSGGGYRGSWTQGTAGADDTNRHWDDGGGLDINIKARAVLTADRGSLTSRMDWAASYHGTHSNLFEVWDTNTSASLTRLVARLNTYTTETVDEVVAAFEPGYDITWFEDSAGDGLRSKFAVISETGDPTPVANADLTEHGEAWVKSFGDMLGEAYFDIFLDATSNSGYQTSNSTATWSHTCTGEERYLIVGVGMLSAAQTASGVTYNGVAMTFIGAQNSGSTRVEMWGLAAPATGANNVVVTLTGAISWSGLASSFTGVHQTSAYEGWVSASATNGGAADATVTATTTFTNSYAVDIVATTDTAITVGTGQTVVGNVTGAGGSLAASYEGPKETAGTVPTSWTSVGAGATWAIGAVVLRPASAPSIGEIAVTEAIPLGDTQTVLLGRSVAITESNPLVDVGTAQYATTASASEALNLGDTNNSSAPGQYPVTATDALTLGDTAASQTALSGLLTEALALSDQSTSAWAAYVSMVEALTLADGQSGNTGIGVNASIAEAMALADGQAQAYSASMSKSSWWAYSIPPTSLAYSIDITINA